MMAHYALIENGIVVNVVVADQDFIDNAEGFWVKTSYNMKHGVYHHHKHPHPIGPPEECVGLDEARARKNFAGIGYTYDEENDIFIPPKPYDDWVLDLEIADWVPPIPYPEQGAWYWDFESKSWVEEVWTEEMGR